MKLAGIDANIVHFGPEWGVFIDNPSFDKPYLHSVHKGEWDAESAAVRLREQGETAIVIKKRMVYHSDWETARND